MSSRRNRRISGRRNPRQHEPAPPPFPRRWLWWRKERDGRPKAKEEFEGLPLEGRAGLAKRVERYLAGESRYKDVDSLGDGIFELRCRHQNNHFRVLFMLWGRHCVALTAFYKNQKQTPKADVERAKSRAKRWCAVFGKEPPN